MTGRLSMLMLVFFLLAFSSDPPPIKSFIANDLSYLVDFYKELHQLPELSLYEKETSRKLAKEMREIGFEVTENFGGYGIVCILKNGDGPTILYRTDMDGLPVTERTDLPYASTHKMQGDSENELETMHACGHDVHMTVWLGTARALAAHQDQWKGTLMFIGQPAEEIGAGARMMLEAGLFERFPVPDYGVGIHSSAEILTGRAGFGKGYTMARAESIDINVFGIGAHGASPHKSIDPVVLASLIVMDLQTIVSRSVDPLEAAVVTVGAIEGGTKHNIIPDRVTLKLTVRTYKESVRRLIHRRIQEIARGVAIAAGLPEEKYPEVIIPEQSTPPNYNNPALVDRMIQSAQIAIGTGQVVEATPKTVAEDFALYGQTSDSIPTVLLWLGTVPESRYENARQNEESLPGLHSPFYYPAPETSIETGVTLMTQIVRDLLMD